uniref:Uncharacterized protein n=1 Tax=Anopheles atroparvus TaxID=41427 RepID=A0AAG5CNN2_ANOAO
MPSVCYPYVSSISFERRVSVRSRLGTHEEPDTVEHSCATVSFDSVPFPCSGAECISAARVTVLF